MATTGILALTLLLFTGLMTFNFLSSSVLADLEDKVDVTAYFTDDATETDILIIGEDLEDLDTVESVMYVSKEEALDKFKERHEDDELIQESLSELAENPLQASLNIKAIDPSYYEDIVGELEASFLGNAIDKINFYENKGVIERVQKISGGVERWGLISVVILGLIAVLVAFNTVRLTIYSQRSEIEVMRLVGAGNGQIRGPHILEGALYGFFGGLIALAVFYPTAYIISPKIGAFAPTIDLFGYFGTYALQVSGMVIGLGIALGIVSSYIAIRRYLKI
jgi:cell division transport system permease protein